MKQFIFLIFIISFIPGCNFLSGDQAQLSNEMMPEEENLDDLVLEEEMDEEEEEELEEEIEDEEEEELEEEMDEKEELEEEIEDESKKEKGFFGWLFGGSDSDEEEPLDEEDLTSEFVGEGEDFYEAERDYEDYEETPQEEMEDNATESIALQKDSSKQNISEQETSAISEESNAGTTETVKITPLNKIIAVPYKKAGQIINAVYIARPNEDLISISQKIYGRNEVDQLLKINTHLQNRSVVVGDKIYYNSPNRSDDNSRLLFYYQDNNISPSYYNLSPGDNIRTVAGQLLGHPKSWKEIWATNPNLQSKSEVESSINIVYWPQSAGQTAYNNSPPTLPPPVELTAENQTELSNEMANNQPNPEQALPNEELKPQIEEDIKQPNPDISVQAQTKKPKGIIQEILNNIEIIVGIIVFLILLYLIVRIIMNKRKQRDFDYTATNIEV